MDQAPDKKQLRKQMKQALLALHPDDLQAMSIAACRNALSHERFRKANIILAYAAMPHEADASYLIEEAKKAGKRVAYPYCVPDSGYLLQALEPLDEQSFFWDPYGIKTPDPDRSRHLSPQEIDLILTPGLAFDLHGGRLGRGAGYYDRYFTCTPAFRMGFCLDIQRVDRVPMNSHDCFMNALVTDVICHNIIL